MLHPHEPDLAGLNWLYPSCDSVVAAPVCFRSQRNIGVLRLFCWVVVPLLVALAILLLLIAWVKHHQRQQLGYYHVKLQEIEEHNHKLLADVLHHEKNHAGAAQKVAQMEQLQVRDASCGAT